MRRRCNNKKSAGGGLPDQRSGVAARANRGANMARTAKLFLLVTVLAAGILLGGRSTVCSQCTECIQPECAAWATDRSGGQFGAAVAAMGDLDGDGHHEWIVGRPSRPSAGAACVVDGRTGSNRISGIREASCWFYGQEDGEKFGFSVASDGGSRVIIGAPKAPRGGSVEVWRLVGGQYESEFRLVFRKRFYELSPPGSQEEFGHAVACAGALGTDGHPEWVVGAPNYYGNGAFFVLDGRSGALHRYVTQSPYTPGCRFSSSLACGDVHERPGTEIIVGAPGQNNVYAYSYQGGPNSGQEVLLARSVIR